MRIVVALLLAVTLAGCKGNAPAGQPAAETPAVAPAVAPNGAAPAPSTAPAAASPADPHSPTGPEPPKRSVAGKVLERIDRGSGMYLRLGTSDGEIWAAVDAAEVKTGAQVTVVNAITMDGFESKALGRKFDRIVFGSLAGAAAPQAKAPTVPPGRGAAAPAPPAASSQASAGSPMPPQMPAQMAMQMPPGPMPPHPPVSAAPTEGAPITVEKAEGAGGRRVAEIFATRASLKDVVVVVRGKVVKFSSNIMGKNWIHLRDGSGSRAAQDDDLTLTTMDSASVGDIVVVRGVLRVNRDFGAGYSYPVIIEDAKVSK